MTKTPDSRIPREMYPDSIGQRLQLIRESFGLKPAEMADLLGVERTYWSRAEKGHRAPSDEIAYLLTVRFGVTLDYLFLGKMDKLPLDVAEKLRNFASKASL